MAELAVSSGNTLAPSAQIGREVFFIGIQATETVLNAALPDVNGVTPSLTNLDLVRKVIDSASSITLIGETAGAGDDDDVTFMIEGFGHNPGGGGAVTQQAMINEIRDQVEALNGSALGTTIVTLSVVSGVTFRVVLTDT